MNTANQLLPPIDDREYVQWDADPGVVIGDDWILPTRLDVLAARSWPLVSPPEATSQSVRAVSGHEVAMGGLNRVLGRMFRGLREGGLGIAAVQTRGAFDLAALMLDRETRDLTVLAAPRFEPDLDYRAEVPDRPGMPPGLWSLDNEGCLTLPKLLIAHPKRYAAGWLDADFSIHCQFDEDGDVTSATADEWQRRRVEDLPGQRPVARLAQHEIDHPLGILFADRVYEQDGQPDPKLLTGHVYGIHQEYYATYIDQMNRIRAARRDELAYADLPELPLPVIPHAQYLALRAGKIRLPRPETIGTGEMRA